MWLKVCCFQLKVDCHVYKSVLYKLHDNHKEALYSRYTKDTERWMKAYHDKKILKEDSKRGSKEKKFKKENNKQNNNKKSLPINNYLKYKRFFAEQKT